MPLASSVLTLPNSSSTVAETAPDDMLVDSVRDVPSASSRVSTEFPLTSATVPLPKTFVAVDPSANLAISLTVTMLSAVIAVT